MKKQINPALIVVAIVIVVAGAAALLFRAATDVPPYPGQNAGKPKAETAGGGNVPTTNEQAKTMHIPGMNPADPHVPSKSGGH
jgi:hypothetical protein